MPLDRIEQEDFDALVLVAFCLTPILVVVYSAFVRNGTLDTASVGEVPATQLLLVVLALGEIGVISRFAWRRRLVGTLFVGVGGLVTLPVVFRIVPGESRVATGYVVLCLVLLCLVCVVEYAFSYATRARQFVSSEITRVPVAIATLHVLVAVGLQLETRTPFSLVGAEIVAALVSLVLLFSITLGTVLTRAMLNLRGPAVLLTGWLVWGTYGTVTYETRLDRFAGVDWSRLDPSPDYLLSTGVLLVLFLAVGGLELLLGTISSDQ